MTKTLLIASGGLDSTVLAYQLAKQGALALMLSFDYNQRHKKELQAACWHARALDVPHKLLDISAVGKALHGSALTDDINVPKGAYSADNLPLTFVSNRNAIMLTIAFGIAAVHRFTQVAIAVHAGDGPIYPDCHPDFIASFAHMQTTAMAGSAPIALYAPFLHLRKKDIIEAGAAMGVPFADCWSCYQGQKTHCGECATCIERKAAFAHSNIPDPTCYQK